ncbi:MBL fold metallo-hydrolase [Rhodoplanes sp. Z2-YC6860]|uniref:MBL fold metallo-hydrolase n=1 Tax=Rhodoplanes sp. Z2-YC6860 TaxID=674703 RepID=UPI001F460419|nr:MBL fold metallo-hydrolase [Rhodoplanes sp. Z2-YC6860]
MRYGGNTPCVELICGRHTLIFDAGTGIRQLGMALVNGANTTDFDIFLSHGHIDHVVGLPFFAPLFVKDQVVRVWGGNLQAAGGVKQAVKKLMSFPFFPLQVDALQARLEFHDFSAGDTINLRPGITLRTAPLNHPGGATGYRVDFNGSSVAYVTDIELGAGTLDPALIDLIKDASLLILDTTYTNEELPSHLGWGHSTWQQGVELANAAKVGRLCLFHHDPEHDDDTMDKIAAKAEAARPGTIVAREGLKVCV